MNSNVVLKIEFAQGWYCRSTDRAQRIENALRDTALLPVNLDINGIEVKQFNLEHWLILSRARSPFLVPAGAPTPIDIGLFLWIVSPEYDPRSFGTSRAFMARLRRYVATRKRRAFLRRVVRQPRFLNFESGIRRYLKRAFMDRPPTSTGASKQIAAGMGASMIYRIAYVTHWSRQAIRQMPLSETFQYLNWIAAPGPAPQFNPKQVNVNARFMDAVNPAPVEPASNGAEASHG